MTCHIHNVSLMDLKHQVNLIENPQDVLFTIFKQTEHRAAIVTSGQLSGMVQIHLAAENKLPFRVCTIDTMRLFPETYTFFEQVEKRYGIEIERIQPNITEVENMVADHGEYLFFDSKAKQQFCCDIRKIRPMQQLLETIDIWITGTRRDQSESRQHIQKVETISSTSHPILKVSPLIHWTTEQVWEYVLKNEVPINPLFLPDTKGHYFESLGCMTCTTRIRPGEPKRAGRWRWQNTTDTDDNNKECGLHYAI